MSFVSRGRFHGRIGVCWRISRLRFSRWKSAWKVVTMTSEQQMRWPVAIRLEMLPGDGLVTKFAKAAEYGFDAVELPGRHLADYKEELLANRQDLPLPVSSISLGFRGSLVSADEQARRRCRDDISDLLLLCSELGARGLVMPPILKMDRHPRLADAGGPESRRQAEDALLLEQLGDLGDCARDNGALLLLEPVNRFETDYLNTISHAADICERLNHPNVGITVDFFHMQIEEMNPGESIRLAGRWVKHVHVAENTRTEPGPGSLDFRPGFEALRDIGYQGCIVLEPRTLSGPAEEVLPRSARYVRDLIG